MSKPLSLPFNFESDKKWIESFLSLKIDTFEKNLHQDEDFFVTSGQKRALEVFHKAALRVPAYKDFLKKNNIDPRKIKTIADFEKVPVTDNKNYIQAYPLEERCWDGELSKSDLIAVSSGTTGLPKFWPRGGFQEYESAITHELLYKYFFNIDKYKTLVIIGFPMGIYVSGMATAIPTWLVSQKKYDITLMTVGNNKGEILRAVKQLQKHYEQVVLIGHPFFIKDVIETGRSEKINWLAKRFHIMSCSEGFNETWRNYLLKLVGRKLPITTMISTYGSSELLLMGFETPMSILAKSYLEHHKDAKNSFLSGGINYFPSIFQYNPLFRYIESLNRELIFTSGSGIPLIRFNMHDLGEVVPFAKVGAFLDGVDAVWKKKIEQWPLWQLPFVALDGRSDNTLIFYAANIYPEHIHAGLNDKILLESITGKFVMRKDYLSSMDQFFEINVELRPNIRPSKRLEREIQKSVIKSLMKTNMEYLDMVKNIKKNVHPIIVLKRYQDEQYFKPGLKPRYIDTSG